MVFAAPISLKEALELAKKNHPQIQAARFSVERAESEKGTARSHFFPTLTLSGKVTRIDDPIVIDLNPIREAMIGVQKTSAYQMTYAITQSEQQAELASQQTGKQLETSLPSFEKEIQDKLFFNATASLMWPIFTGGRIYSAYKASTENIDVSKAELEYTQNAILMDVCSRYFTLRLVQELLQLHENTLKNLQEHALKAQKLEEGGQISKAERLRAEVSLVLAENEYDNARRDLSLARLALVNVIGGDTNTVTITPLENNVYLEPVDIYRKKALEHHPGLRRLQLERSRSERALSAARGEYFPTVALFGQKELYKKDLTILEPEWAVGVGVSWNVFQGGETASRVASAKALHREIGSLQQKTTEDILLLIEKRFREFEFAESQLNSLNKTEELAEESLRSQQLAFEAGLATSLDVVDAELALKRLQIAKLKANYDAIIAFAGLLESTGEIESAGILLEKNNE